MAIQPWEYRCTPGVIQLYLGKISGPLVDRTDIHIEVPAVAYNELRGRDDRVCSAEIRECKRPAPAVAAQALRARRLGRTDA